jgi:putative phosphoribosyl transferase
MLFQDRTEAGQRLAEKLAGYANRTDVIVLALPRGGVPVAYQVAHRLHLPLDIFVVRKLGVPGHEELAMGAIAGSGVRILNRHVIDNWQIPPEVIDFVTRNEAIELDRRERLYRDHRPLPDLEGKTAILVDDGLATGSTMRAAARALREENPARILVAVPVAGVATCENMRHYADDVICAETPDPFYAVGMWYGNFSQTTDEEVKRLLKLAWQEETSATSSGV